MGRNPFSGLPNKVKEEDIIDDGSSFADDFRGLTRRGPDRDAMLKMKQAQAASANASDDIDITSSNKISVRKLQPKKPGN